MKNRPIQPGDPVNWVVNNVLYYGIVAKESSSPMVEVQVKYKGDNPCTGIHCVQFEMLTICE